MFSRKKLLQKSNDHISFHPCVKLKLFPMESEKYEKLLKKTPQLLSKPVKFKSHPPGNPKISLISPSFNQARFLPDLLKTTTNQSFQNYEHIVVDGGSSDKTVDILKKHKHIRWLSEKDSGYNEAFKKGLLMAKGKYIINAAISDGFLDKDWFKRCVDILDHNPDVSLVWGFPQNLSEEGIPGKISFPYFHLVEAPQKSDFFYFWLRTGHAFPEGNLCVRKNVLKKCLPGLDNHSDNYHIWKEFALNFATNGYLSYHLPIVANYGRTHKGALGQQDLVTGLEKKLQGRYINRVRLYRWLLLFGIKKHTFRSGSGRALPLTFSPKEFWRQYLNNYIGRAKHQLKKHLFRT
jgi:glycosyltransferase involved in cell wall biosynthesis